MWRRAARRPADRSQYRTPAAKRRVHGAGDQRSGLARPQRVCLGLGYPGFACFTNITANPTGLSPGLYSGQITVTDSNSSNQAIVNVILTVTNSAQSIQISENGLSFTGVTAGSQPPQQEFTVSNPGAGNLNWTAQASTLAGGSWLSVSPFSGAAASGQSSAPVPSRQTRPGWRPDSISGNQCERGGCDE